MATTVAPVDLDLSLVDRITKIEDSLKELKRAARQGGHPAHAAAHPR